MTPTTTTGAPLPYPDPSNTQTNNTSTATAGTSLHLIEKLLNRLKSLKRGHSHHSHSHSDVPTKNQKPSAPQPQSDHSVEVNSVVNPQPDSAQSTPQIIEPPDHDERSPQKRNIDMAEYTQFCEELGQLLRNVWEVQELSTFTGTYPSILRRRLDQDALELRSLYSQVREALHNIVRVKEQRRAVRKERNVTTKALAKIRDQEVREMEGLISQYDKPLMARWEKLKHTLQPELLENFLQDIKGKRQALDHVTTLANQRLSQLSNATTGSPSATTSSTLSGSAPSGFLAATLRDEKAGSSSATNRRNSVSGSGRTNGMRWKKHYERHNRSTSSSNGQESLQLSLVPLRLNSIPAPSYGLNVIPLTGASVTAATTATSSSNSLPSSPGSSVIPPNTPIAPQQNYEDIVFNAPGSSTGTPGSLTLSGPACIPGGMIIGPTLPERRSMLQALFGDLRRSTETPTGTFVTLNHPGNSRPSTALGTVSTAVVVTAPEDGQLGSNGSTNGQANGNENNRDIELFTIDRPT